MLVVHGFFGIIQHFGWKRVRLIAQDEEIYATVSVSKGGGVTRKITIILNSSSNTYGKENTSL